ncbi:FAD-dependent monooxygenase [Nocardia alni]|uniref:FAD-dependent monooxygenase n=1 Tax=Nocardia alni TaxID=2815723 RepID=UPI0027DF3C63|nr:FAD-dependent monooxygenase [Nocardia alni]
MRVTDTDVVIVGAGPTGSLLASELCLTGVRPMVLERRATISDVPKAGGLGGQILHLLRYRGLLERLTALSPDPGPAPIFPFGGVHVDLSNLADPPLQAMVLAQQELERVLGDHASALGADVRRGHEVVAASQDDDAVSLEVRGPDGPYRVNSRYVVGCDGGRSRVRDLAGIPFPGNTYPEVNRLGQVTLPDSVTILDSGDLDVPGFGRVGAGFTRTGRGLLGLAASTESRVVSLYTIEDELAEYDDDLPLTPTELQDSIRRVLGAEIPLGEPIRLSRFTFQARQAQRYRAGRMLLAGDAAHLFPATGVALNAGMLDGVNLAWKLAADIAGWAPPDLLDIYHDERHFAATRTMLHTQAQVALRRGHDPAAQALRDLLQELLLDEQPARRIGAFISGADIRYPMPDHHPLTGTFAPDLTLHTDHGTTSLAKLMHPARPILLDLTDRPDLREIAQGWHDRIDIHTATTDHHPQADALLIRPDAHIAWAATADEPAAPTLREALSYWFGSPSATT